MKSTAVVREEGVQITLASQGKTGGGGVMTWRRGVNVGGGSALANPMVDHQMEPEEQAKGVGSSRREGGERRRR